MAYISFYHVEVIYKDGTVKLLRNGHGYGYDTKENAEKLAEEINKDVDVALARVKVEISSS